MQYFDTSFLAPLFREERTSSRIGRFIAELPVAELAVSRWTEGEEARDADALFTDVVLHSFIVLLPSANDYELARNYLFNFATGLRGGDALHLAVAANHRAQAIYSLDKTMVTAGRILGLPVSAGIGPG
jgi:uncharacterized protein